MLTIRFNRTGKRNKAQFRIVLQEHTVAPGGRHVEVLGSWDPHLKKGVFRAEKIKGWIGKGAQVSDSVWNLLIRQGVISGKKRPVKIPKPATEKSESKEAEAGGAGTALPATPKKDEVKNEERKTEEKPTEESKEK